MKTITYNDFQKLNLVVAQILKAENIEEADKLYKLTLDVGEEQRTIVAGIKQFYKPKELENKKIIIIANLEPITLKDVQSNGMLLAASSKETNQCVLITTDKEIPVGTKIS